MASLLVAAGVAAATAASTAATVGTVFTVVSAAASVAGGVLDYKAGQDAQAQADLNAQVEDIAARNEAIAVNEELLQTMSRNTASSAAGGLASSGSVARAQEQAKQKAAEELSTQQFNARARQDAIKAQGRTAAGAGTAGAVGGLFGAVEILNKGIK